MPFRLEQPRRRGLQNGVPLNCHISCHLQPPGAFCHSDASPQKHDNPWNSGVVVDAGGGVSLSSLQRTVRPACVRVAAIRLTIMACVSRGCPRQFWLMNAKSRCSILFHLLVPGGRWQTGMVSPLCVAKRCSSHFHSRTRASLLPSGPERCPWPTPWSPPSGGGDREERWVRAYSRPGPTVKSQGDTRERHRNGRPGTVPLALPLPVPLASPWNPPWDSLVAPQPTPARESNQGNEGIVRCPSGDFPRGTRLRCAVPTSSVCWLGLPDPSSGPLPGGNRTSRSPWAWPLMICWNLARSEVLLPERGSMWGVELI